MVKKARWWEVKPVLITNEADWPNESGSSGITSVKRLRAAEAAGDATEVRSNFFLFFDYDADGAYGQNPIANVLAAALRRDSGYPRTARFRL